jgi:hypothetical protein
MINYLYQNNIIMIHHQQLHVSRERAHSQKGIALFSRLAAPYFATPSKAFQSEIGLQ